jgi:hypothetical protein
MLSRTFRLLVAAGAALLATGCVVYPAQPYYTGEVAQYGDVVTVAPPAPQVEYIGPPPVAGYVWLGGYWGWQGGRHVWVGGHWSPPRPGYHWVPHTWQPYGRGWRMNQGHWAR